MQKLVGALLLAIKDIIVSLMEYFTSDFWSVFSLEKFEYRKDGFYAGGIFDTYFPGMKGFERAILSFALFLCLFLLILELIQVFFNGKKEPAKALARYGIAFIAVCLSYNIMYVIEIPFAEIFDAFKGVADAKNSFLASEFSLGDSGMEKIAGTGEALKDIAGTLLYIALLISALFAYLRLILEMVERYLMIGILFYTAPLGFSAIAAPESGVFSRWLKMVISEYALMISNIIFLYVFCYSYSHYPEGAGHKVTDLLLFQCLMIGWLNIGSRVDQYLKGLGLSTAQNGGLTAMAVTSSVRDIGRMAGRTITHMSAPSFKRAGSAVKNSAIEKATGVSPASEKIDPGLTGPNGENIRSVVREAGLASSGLHELSKENLSKAEDLSGISNSGAVAASISKDKIDFDYGEVDKDGNKAMLSLGDSSKYAVSDKECLHTQVTGADGITRTGVWTGSRDAALKNADAFGAGRLEKALSKEYGKENVSKVKDMPGAFKVIGSDGKVSVAELPGLYKAQGGSSSYMEKIGYGKEKVSVRLTSLDSNPSYKPHVADTGGKLVKEEISPIAKVIKQKNRKK